MKYQFYHYFIWKSQDSRPSRDFIPQFYKFYFESLFRVATRVCAHDVRRPEGMRIPNRKMCVGNEGVGVSNPQHRLKALEKFPDHFLALRNFSERFFAV